MLKQYFCNHQFTIVATDRLDTPTARHISTTSQCWHCKLIKRDTRTLPAWKLATKVPVTGSGMSQATGAAKGNI